MRDTLISMMWAFRVSQMIAVAAAFDFSGVRTIVDVAS
jgi:hypothetical protein